MKKIFLLIITFQLACAEIKNIKVQTDQNLARNQQAQDTLKYNKDIRSVIQDRKGNYWIGSNQEGFCKYDRNTFTYFTPKNGFCGKQVIYIKEDSTGVIWFGTSSRLCSFENEQFISVVNKQPVIPWSSQNGDLWFPGNKDGQIIRIYKGMLYVYKYPLKVPEGKNLRDYGITCFTKSSRGCVWIGHYSGVVHFDGKNLIQINDSLMHFDGNKEYMHVHSIPEDSKGRLWIGNNGNGVQLIEGDSIDNFYVKYNFVSDDIFEFSTKKGTLTHVFAFKEDSKGNFCFGDRDTGAWEV